MKKIMLNDKYGLTKAVLEGRKTQTRRIVDESLIDEYDNWLDDVMCIAVPAGTIYEKIEDFLLKRSRYVVGEIVAVAQSYKTIDDFYKSNFSEFDGISDEDIQKWNMIAVNYRGKKVWTNKLFVKPELMLHFIRITNVRIERLQDISDEDCLAEGVIKWDAGQTDVPFFTYPNAAKCDYDSPQDAYASLIDKVGKKGDWERNPYVWVYDFELVK